MSSSSSSSKLSDTISKYIEIKEKLSELEKKSEKYRDYIEHCMNKDDLSEMPYSSYIIKKYVLTRETISKKDVPKSIWDEYHKKSSSTVIRILNKKDKKDDEKREKKVYDSE
jgi:hypothetical protein